MKMAKASEKDIDAAGKLCQILNALDEGNRFRRIPHDQPADITELKDFNPDRFDHLKILYLQLMNLMHAQPSFHNRVIGGMCYVIMYDANEIIDPNSDHLDLHPRFSEAFDDLARETQAARYWNMRYHQVAQELEQVKLSAQRVSQEWATIWSPIDDLVRPLTPLGESVSAKALELISKAVKTPAYSHDVSHAEIVSLIENVRRWGLDHTGCEPSVSCFHQAVDNLRMALENPPAMPIPKQEPDKQGYFAYDGENGFDLFDSAQDAENAAQKSLDSYRDWAHEGWDEGVQQVCWGKLHGSITSENCGQVEFEGEMVEEVNYKLFRHPLPAQAAAIPDWIPISEAPKTGKKMLLSLVNIAGKRRTIVGFWVERFSVEDNGDDDQGEEKDGTYYWQEGWYESMESHDDFSCLYANQKSITHFMPLPESPKPDSTGGESKRLAPWPDFKGNPIHEGDTISHPDGTSGIVIFDGTQDGAVNQWRVDYRGEFPSRLCMQIGEKGMAVVVGGES
jgi:hypothetical protein